MIGKQDWYEMAEQIKRLEEKMESGYIRLAAAVQEPRLHDAFTALSHDERNHAIAVEEMMWLIKRG